MCIPIPHRSIPFILLLHRHHCRQSVTRRKRSLVRTFSAMHSDNSMEQLTLYQSAIAHLNSLQSNAMVIQKMREKRDLLQETNIPATIQFLEKSGITLDQVDSLNVIHVSGTKGKGSTCAFVEAILRKQGLKTGLYTSPHLVHARERIRINSEPISEALFAKHFFHVYDKLKAKGDDELGMPAYFKFLTLMSFHVFLAEKVDVAIVEVGIGGEYDCTNIVKKPVVCGITTIDYDHTSILGNTLKDISWHKAGILKTNVPAIYAADSTECSTVFQARAKDKQTSVSEAPPFTDYKWPSDNVSTGIAGDHQKLNVSVALQLVRSFVERTKCLVAFREDKWQLGQAYEVPTTFVEAIESCRWPGRSQILTSGNTCFFLDGAHTPKSMEMCSLWFKKELSKQDNNRKRGLVFQCTADRNPSTLLPFLNELNFDFALFCPTIINFDQNKSSDLTNFNQSTSNQMTKSLLCAKAWEEMGNKDTHVFDCISSLMDWVREKSSQEENDILVTGSLHLVGGVLSIIESS